MSRPIFVFLVFSAVVSAGCVGPIQDEPEDVPTQDKVEDGPDPSGADFAFGDPRGDTERSGKRYLAAGAAALDVVKMRLHDRGTSLEFHLVMKSLSGIADGLEEDGFHAQYALSFVTADDPEGYSVRALFGGMDYTQQPGGGWRFQLHEKGADEWADADGKVLGSALVWKVSYGTLGVRSGDQLSGWSVQTWASGDTLEQYGDWADTERSHVLGS
ncbi:MAG: hypothetical protein KY455_07700 [Euryarchaeota archaeon]|nr:hypothetical protein [Euryarchaeota archaeon]